MSGHIKAGPTQIKHGLPQICSGLRRAFQEAEKELENANSTAPTGGIEGWNIESKSVYQPTQVQSYTKYRAFWVNGDGIIYRWERRGL